MKVRRTYSY